ncbi:MAG: DUF1080 domain-containing protein [Spirochaetes bacterium]|nr:DUF1080 domain-containing protein [Spirochaetota bacterium]
MKTIIRSFVSSLIIITACSLMLPAAVLFEDTFNAPSSAWHATAGTWTPGNREIISTGGGKYVTGSAKWKNYTIRMRIFTESPGKDTWNVAGMLVRYTDEKNHYAVVLHTTGKIELAKMHNGKWLDNRAHAQTKNAAAQWSDLSATVTGGTITVSVNGETLITYTDPEPLLRGGIGLLNNGAKQARFAAVNVTSDDAAVVPKKAGRTTVGIFTRTLSGAADAETARLSAAFIKAGYSVLPVSEDDAVTEDMVSTDRFFLYIIPGAQQYPANGCAGITEFISQKGSLIVTGGEAFTKPLYKRTTPGGGWIDRAGYEVMLNSLQAESVAVNFENTINWSFSGNDAAGSGASMTIAPDGVKGNCTAYEVKNLTGWATYYSPVMGPAFPADHDVLCLWAKGDAATPSILIELNEKDGSRWLYTLKISPEWKSYAIPFEDFVYWHDSPTKNTRGGSGDTLKPNQVVKFNFGMALGNQSLKRGEYRFRIDELGSAKNPLGSIRADIKRNTPPIIETISPSYKVFPLSNIKTLVLEQSQRIVPASLRITAAEGMYAPIRRPTGAGFTGANKWRFIPLINAFDANREYRGSPLSLIITVAGGGIPSLAGFCGVTPDASMTSALIAAAERIADGVFLIEAGSTRFSYYPDEPVALGARIMNAGDGNADVLLRITVRADGKTVFQKEEKVSIEKGAVTNQAISTSATLPAGTTGTVRTELVRGGEVIDVIEHEIGILPARNYTPAADEFVTVRGSDFYCKGKRWYPNGINYWPLNVSGLEPDVYNAGWLTPGFYNPEEIERDLTLMNKLGINMVSIQMQRTNAARNLLDFFRRCERHDIKVNGFLDGASPTDFEEWLESSIIREANLANQKALFAYDIIWEASNHVFNIKKRTRWNKQWNEWIKERYGSIENAIKDWNHSPETIPEGITQPKQEELMNDGAWRIYVAAYRRFMDDFTSRIWNDAHRRIKKYDSNHLISFRQGNTTYFDFAFTSPMKHIAFVEPEGYGYPHDDETYYTLGFSTRYVQFTSGGKPVYWSEFGKSVWNRATMRPDEALQKVQDDYNEKYYRMLMDTGANGLAPWWWPGGYRVNEKSDFGIMNPDGTPRKTALIAQEYAKRITSDRTVPAPDVWFEFDREAHAGGYWRAVFNEGRDAFRDACIKGKNLGIKTPGTGTDSANTPLVSVGNTTYNGSNPPKYLDAEFNYLAVKIGDTWTNIYGSGGSIALPAGKPVTVKLSIGNIGEAVWLSPKAVPGTGGVYVSTRSGDAEFREPIIADTPRLADAETGSFTLVPSLRSSARVVFEMTARDRMWFGEKWEITFVAH